MPIQQIMLDSPALHGNPLGDPHQRQVTLILPPHYADEPDKRYPSLYWLPAHGKNDQAFLNWKPWEQSLPDQLLGWMAAGEVGEAIIIIPDMWTRLGSSQYLNSAMGRYADFLIQDLVPHIDANFRTSGDGGRGVIGHSSGGYGAIVSAMRYSAIFSAVSCHAGDMYWEYTCLPMLPKLADGLAKYGGAAEFLRTIPEIKPKGGTFWNTVMAMCWAMAHGENPDAELGFDLPIDPTTGALDSAVWQRWLAFDPVRIIDEPAAQAALKGMKRVYLTAGDSDEFGLHLGARIFAAKLREFGIQHIHEEHPGGHSSNFVPYQRAFALLTEALGG